MPHTRTVAYPLESDSNYYLHAWGAKNKTRQRTPTRATSADDGVIKQVAWHPGLSKVIGKDLYHLKTPSMSERLTFVSRKDAIKAFLANGGTVSQEPRPKNVRPNAHTLGQPERRSSNWSVAEDRALLMQVMAQIVKLGKIYDWDIVVLEVCKIKSRTSLQVRRRWSYLNPANRESLERRRQTARDRSELLKDLKALNELPDETDTDLSMTYESIDTTIFKDGVQDVVEDLDDDGCSDCSVLSSIFLSTGFDSGDEEECKDLFAINETLPTDSEYYESYGLNTCTVKRPGARFNEISKAERKKIVFSRRLTLERALAVHPPISFKFSSYNERESKSKITDFMIQKKKLKAAKVPKPETLTRLLEQTATALG